MRTLITGGTVISMDPATGDLDRGDVLLEDHVDTFWSPVEWSSAAVDSSTTSTYPS